MKMYCHENSEFTELTKNEDITYVIIKNIRENQLNQTQSSFKLGSCVKKFHCCTRTPGNSVGVFQIGYKEFYFSC